MQKRVGQAHCFEESEGAPGSSHPGPSVLKQMIKPKN